jgi:transposase
MGGDDHRCEWRDKAEALESRLAQVEAALAKLQRHRFGKRSEKMPPVDEALRDAGILTDPAAALEKRRDNAEKKRALVTREINHRVLDEQKTCPKCGGHEFTPVGKGKITEEYELVPAQIERRLHIQEKLRCRCGETILTAPGATRVFDKARYGPAFMANVVVQKIADAIPLHRQAKQFQRSGVPLHRSTLADLFHRTADIVAPLSHRLLQLIPLNDIVHADETTVRVLAKGKTRTSWLWTFLANQDGANNTDDKPLIGYVYSPTRSGETPVKVLGETVGGLVSDKYSGYNKVTVPGRRERVGCLAHVRRRFFDALPTAPEAQRALDHILEVYKVERAARDGGVLGTPPISRCARCAAAP